MKTKRRSGFAAVFLALAMLLSLVPVEMFVRTSARADGTAQDFVLDISTEFPKNLIAGTWANGAKVKKGTDKFFSIYMSAKSKITDNSKDFGDGVGKPARRLDLNEKTDLSVPKCAIKFTTGSANATVTVYWASGGNGRQVAILDEEGKSIAKTSETSVKNDPYTSTLTIPNVGTYYLANPDGNNYIIRVVVNTVAPPKPDPVAWNTVASPSIASTTVNGEKITVKVTANVDDVDGGDSVIVDMLDENGKVVKSEIKYETDPTVDFTPTKSGKYTFKATLAREIETTKKESAVSAAVDFTLPLAKPTIASATNKGNGSVEIKWNAVAEATGYNVYVGSEKKTASPITERAYTVTGLTVGTSYDFYVEAVRGSDTKKSDKKTTTVVAEEQREWSATYFGTSTGSSKNKVTGDLNADGTATIIATGGGGKIVPGGNGSGLTYYYTTIPDSLNFTLRGKFTLNNWKFDNGQEGFGLLALDRLPDENLNNSATFWTNQYLMGMTKNEYRWDSEKGKFSYDDNVGDKYTMKNGVCVSAVIEGLTPENLSQTSDTNFINKVAPKNTYSLEKYAVDMGQPAGTYNVIGNSYTDEADNKVKQVLDGTIKELTTFDFELQRNNTGYFMTYYDESGRIVGQQKFYDTQALSKLNSEKVFVGFFAARRANVTISNVTLTTIAPEDDAPAEERPVELIDPSVAITSAAVANSPDYNLTLNANVAGTADITLNGGSAGSGNVTAKTLFSKALELDQGVNQISVVFKPDPDQALPEYTKLANSDPITVEINVNYNTRLSEQKNLYVSPSGSKNGNGGKDHPLDIHTAVGLVQPGQTIVIMEGTYSLTSPVRIERGINGTADAKIRMIADPEAASRPVFDFNKVCEGFRLGGNYWYVQGFDVTNTGNGLAGFRVCGSYNTLDRIEAYNNGNTGIQISAFRDSSDPRELWPHDNLILNCTSYNNADSGREDADGFAAKLTIGEGNVFDGCAAYNNADDGWDLYAKVSSGPIGSVTIKNCIAYNNGFMLDGSDAGNGNGFKLGGENLPGGHKLINSFSFGNKAHGITSNSCPDVQVINCTSYNNGNTAHSGGKDKLCNLTLYTNNKDITTSFVVNGLISCAGKSPDEVKKNTNDKTVESNMKNVSADAFVSTTFSGLKRKANGTLDLGNFLKLKDDADKTIGADFDKPGSSQPSEDIREIVPDENLPAPLPDYAPVTPSTGDNKKPIEFEDSKTEIEVTAPDGAFDNVENVKFNADPVPEETNDEEFTYDLFFTDKDGNKLQPKTAVTVKIPVPTALKDKTIFVYHVENDGKYTEIDCKVENGMVVFTAKSFSKYIITSKKLAASDDSSATTSDTSANNSGSSTTSGGNSNPSTGVTIPITRFVVFFAGAAALCVFKRKRS